MSNENQIPPNQSENTKKGMFLKLRRDLEITPAPATDQGIPSWTIYDPLVHRFYRIGWLEFNIIARWHLEDFKKIVTQVNKECPTTISTNEVNRVFKFLLGNNLLEDPSPDLSSKFAQRANEARPTWLKYLLAHYLYFKVPLFNPDKLFSILAYYFRFIYTKWFFMTMIAIFVFSSFLIMRRWDEFIGTFHQMFNIERMAYYVLIMCFMKIAHELGHGITAKRYGAKIPTMGVAFLVMWPMLYTDISDSWRAQARRMRIASIIGGITAETIIVTISMLLWCVVNNEVARSLFFMIITVGWMSTLVVNLNPLMRFDGYHLLSDLLNVPNLQERSFALAKWYMRRTLFGFSTPIPEQFLPHTHRWLIIYAYAIWFYRLFVFTAIAITVYHVFFKILGIFLFIVEMYVFIASPIIHEVQNWWQQRGMFKINARFLLTMSALVASFIFACVPWQSNIFLPSVVTSKSFMNLYPAIKGKISEINITEGQAVKANQPLVKIVSNDLEYYIKQALININVLEQRMRYESNTPGWKKIGEVVLSELNKARSDYQGLLEKQENLIIKSQVEGVITDVEDYIKPNTWVNTNQKIATVVDPTDIVVVGYAKEHNLGDIKPGQKGIFVPESDIISPLNVEVMSVGINPSTTLEYSYLSSQQHGEIMTIQDKRGRLLPVESIYMVEFKILNNSLSDNPTSGAPPALIHTMRGTLKLSTQSSHSLFMRLFKALSSGIISESGF